MKTVLVRESDRDCLGLLRIALTGEEWRIETLHEGDNPSRRIDAAHPDVVVIDMDRPDSERLLQAGGSSQSVAVAMTSDSGDARAIALHVLGADAVYTLPVAPDLLAVRLDAAVRCIHKHIEPGTEVYRFEDLTVDLRSPTVMVGTETIHLSATESTLLRILAMNAGRIVTHDQLLNLVWGERYEGSHDLLRTYVHNLRRRLREAGFKHELIHTERQLGYWVPREPALPGPEIDVRLPASPIREQTRLLRERLREESERLLGSVHQLHRTTRQLGKWNGETQEQLDPNQE